MDTGSLVSIDEAPLTTKVEAITQLLQRACAESAVRRGRPRATARWWTRDLDLARSEKLSHERRWKRLRTRHGADDPRTMAAHALFSRARTRYVNQIRHTKRESWIRCVQLGSTSDPWGTAYKILAGKYKALPPLVSLRVDQQVVHQPQQIVRTMLQGILPDDSPVSDTYWHQQLRRDVPLRMAGPVELPDELDVQYAVHGQKNGKAPGDDGIRPEILKRGYDLSLIHISFLQPKQPKQGMSAYV